jgi:hypothetical protein
VRWSKGNYGFTDFDGTIAIDSRHIIVELHLSNHCRRGNKVYEGIESRDDELLQKVWSLHDTET